MIRLFFIKRFGLLYSGISYPEITIRLKVRSSLSRTTILSWIGALIHKLKWHRRKRQQSSTMLLHEIPLNVSFQLVQEGLKIFSQYTFQIDTDIA